MNETAPAYRFGARVSGEGGCFGAEVTLRGEVSSYLNHMRSLLFVSKWTESDRKVYDFPIMS